MNRAELQKQFEELKSLSDTGTAADRRERGRQFEVLLRELLETEGLDPRIRIRLKGEEIDGSFIYGDRVFLLEAKWHAAPLPASSIYQFKGKVDGKLLGTLGIFISVSGYSEDTVDALTLGKELNVILFDETDIEAAVSGSFRKVLQNKLRAAAEEGVVYLRSQITVASSELMHVQALDKVVVSEYKSIVAIVEGQSDEIIIAEFARKILKKEGLSAHVNIMMAGGPIAASRLSRLSKTSFSPGTQIIVVADGDGDKDRVYTSIKDGLHDIQAKIIVVEPNLFTWLLPPEVGHTKEKFRAFVAENHVIYSEFAYQTAPKVSIEQLRDDNSDFANFYDVLVKAAK